MPTLQFAIDEAADTKVNHSSIGELTAFVTKKSEKTTTLFLPALLAV